MKKKIYYFKKIYLALIIFIILAIVNFKLSFALYDTMNMALNGEWDLFLNQAIIVMSYTVLLLPLGLLSSFVKSYVIKEAMIGMKGDYINRLFNKNISEFQTENNALYVSTLTNDFNLIEKDYVEQIIILMEAFINFVTSILIVTLISPLLLLIGVAMIGINA